MAGQSPAFLLGDKAEWNAQMNVNAALLHNAGFKTTSAQIIAILKDWSRSRSRMDRDYPPIPIMVKPIKLWGIEEQMRYIGERVDIHKAAESLPDNELPLCTAEERWQRNDSWAIKADGNKKATKVCHTEADSKVELSAIAAANPKKKYSIEFRKGESIRCGYCSARQFCDFGRQQVLSDDE